MSVHAFRKTKTTRGFSLLEVMIVVFIFALIMTAVTAYFAKMALVNQTTKQLQRNLEDTQLAFNLIGKTLRTAVIVIPVVSSNVATVRLYDYSQTRCIIYQFSGGTIQQAQSTSAPASGDDEKVWCQSLSAPNFTSLAPIVSTADGATVSGTFLVTPSTDSVAGRVTMIANVSRGTNSSSIQTTVSLRNFREHL